jgi:putative transcriptional regulator
MKAATKEISETKEVAMSDILKSVHKTVKGLKKVGAIDKTTMRRFDILCLTSINEFTPEQVLKLRLANNLSQLVLRNT